MWPDGLSEARLAILIAVASASFTFWQAWSGHVVAQATRAAQKRKHPVFEIACTDGPHDEWRHVSITSRNSEAVAATVTGYKYRGRGVLLLSPSDLKNVAENALDAPEFVFPEMGGARTIKLRKELGAGGEQMNRSDLPGTARPTEYLHIYAKGPFDRKLLEVLWEWSDGTPR